MCDDCNEGRGCVDEGPPDDRAIAGDLPQAYCPFDGTEADWIDDSNDEEGNLECRSCGALFVVTLSANPRLLFDFRQTAE